MFLVENLIYKRSFQLTLAYSILVFASSLSAIANVCPLIYPNGSNYLKYPSCAQAIADCSACVPFYTADGYGTDPGCALVPADPSNDYAYGVYTNYLYADSNISTPYGASSLFALCGLPGLDLSTSTPQIFQNGLSIVSGGVVESGVVTQIVVPISGSGFDSPETRSTFVQLQIGSHTLNQIVSLATIKAAGTLNVSFYLTFGPQDFGQQIINTVIDPGNDLQENNFSNNSTEYQINIQPIITISSVQITQAVNNFNLTDAVNGILPASDDSVTLVQGRNTLILATVTASGASVNDSTPVKIIATMPGGSQAIGTTTVGTAAANDGSHNVIILSQVDQPLASGSISLMATIGDVPVSNSVTKSIQVKATNPLNLIYYPIQDGNDAIGIIRQRALF